MKKFLLFSLMSATLFTTVNSSAQDDKSKRPSPPATVSQTTTTGNKITIDYSQPIIKGRTIGQDIAPLGKVWRTGANEATTFEITKDALIEGKPLPKGKYSLYSIPGENSCTIIFNKTWKQWGTKYTEADDALRVEAATGKTDSFTEKMTFTIDKTDKVNLMWGDYMVGFTVK